MGGFHRLYKHSIVEFEHLLLRSVVLSALAAPLLRLLGAHIGKNARIHTPLHVHNTPYSHLIMGKNCHVGRDVFLDLSRRICIGDNVTISMRSTLITHFDVGDSPLKYCGYPSDEGDIVIHDGVYIGAGATVLHGVEIGENSLIAAGTLLKISVPPYSLVAGTPGRVVKTIEALSVSPDEVDGLQSSIRHTI